MGIDNSMGKQDYGLTLDAWGTLFRASDNPEPGLLECIANLPANLPLGVVTNTGTQGRLMVQHLLAEWGIADRFRVIVASGELGFSKPHPRPFEHAAGHLGVELSHLIHVGDSPSGDVRGIQEAGGIGIHYAPDGYGIDDADAVLTHWQDLPALLNKWISAAR